MIRASEKPRTIQAAIRHSLLTVHEVYDSLHVF
jgi:hypothetical protein